ncbi:MAG: ParB/RepB/Spo0J family partition protein [Massilibacteroides sp.]|nr:ParB/RepB/Spo0J family partition protein [Massilibacteroides sp.]
MATHKRSALGRGLDALISIDDVMTEGSSSINEIELIQIHPNPNQPRTLFEDETLKELAISIKSLGVIQPITVKETAPDKYLIISGERRYRAALLAELKTIPAYIKKAKDENVVEMALIENIQREDLNAIEVALAYQSLIDNYSLTQERLSERIGKKRATITNYLRLLKLPAEIQIGLQKKEIDMGHARALLPLADAAMQLNLYERTQKNKLSVREVERAVKEINERTSLSKSKDTGENKNYKLPQEYNLLSDQLSKIFRTKVKLTCTKKGKGQISIPFSSEDELEKLIVLLDKMK